MQTITITCLFKWILFVYKKRVAPKVAPKFFSVFFLRKGGMAAARAFRGSRQENSRALTAGQAGRHTGSRHMTCPLFARRVWNINPPAGIFASGGTWSGGRSRGLFWWQASWQRLFGQQCCLPLTSCLQFLQRVLFPPRPRSSLRIFPAAWRRPVSCLSRHTGRPLYNDSPSALYPGVAFAFFLPRPRSHQGIFSRQALRLVMALGMGPLLRRSWFLPLSGPRGIRIGTMQPRTGKYFCVRDWRSPRVIETGLTDNGPHILGAGSTEAF